MNKAGCVFYNVSTIFRLDGGRETPQKSKAIVLVWIMLKNASYVRIDDCYTNRQKASKVTINNKQKLMLQAVFVVFARFGILSVGVFDNVGVRQITNGAYVIYSSVYSQRPIVGKTKAIIPSCRS